MNDRLEDAQFEVRRLLLFQDEMNSLSYMRDGLKLLMSGVEAANSSVNLLQLSGWSASINKEIDSSRFDSDLSRIYKKYWRRGSSSPEAALIFGILGSAGSWHFKSQFLRRPATSFQGMPRVTPAADDSDDDEGLPEGFMR